VPIPDDLRDAAERCDLELRGGMPRSLVAAIWVATSLVAQAPDHLGRHGVAMAASRVTRMRNSIVLRFQSCRGPTLSARAFDGNGLLFS